MIMKQFDFSGHNWEYEETPVFSFGVDNKEGEKEKVPTHEGEGGSDEEPNDKDGEGGSDEAAGSDEASGSDEEFQTPKGSATVRKALKDFLKPKCITDFDPSQTNNDNDASDWWTPKTTVRKLRKGGSKQSNAPLTSAKWDRWTGGPSKKLQLSDSPMADDGSPQASLYYFTEESWDRFTKWSTNPTALRIGPFVFNLTFAQRIVCAGKWLGNEEMDAMMYIWREKTSLRRWNIDRVAFMNAMFCLQIEKEYKKCKDDKRGYVVPDLLLSYGRGELPSHGRTNRVWGVDVDRLYFPLFVNGML
ncbi:hypothetical protein Bca52824_049328 [Brassica carinata]|uniref:Uncharacterized protein n=1 Tax=Brassica carinata TaxID=52824 RepID=A0A8X7UT03_BRACI|nr:hypothetical protein Bca52824_049328 [Brassica carinata]